MTPLYIITGMVYQYCFVCVSHQNQKYSLQTHFTHMFDSVHELIGFYRENYLPNRHTNLSKPYSELTGSVSS